MLRSTTKQLFVNDAVVAHGPLSRFSLLVKTQMLLKLRSRKVGVPLGRRFRCVVLVFAQCAENSAWSQANVSLSQPSALLEARQFLFVSTSTPSSCSRCDKWLYACSIRPGLLVREPAEGVEISYFIRRTATRDACLTKPTVELWRRLHLRSTP